MTRNNHWSLRETAQNVKARIIIRGDRFFVVRRNKRGVWVDVMSSKSEHKALGVLERIINQILKREKKKGKAII